MLQVFIANKCCVCFVSLQAQIMDGKDQTEIINSILEEGSIDKKGSNLVTLTLQNVESSLTVKCTVYSAHYNAPTIICHQCSSMSNFIVDVFKTWGFTLLRTIMNTNLKPSVFVTTTAITLQNIMQ